VRGKSRTGPFPPPALDLDGRRTWLSAAPTAMNGDDGQNGWHRFRVGHAEIDRVAPMISLKHNFLYVHIPKTAGNAVQNILRHYSEDKIVCVTPLQDGVERFEVRSDQFKIEKHSTLEDYRRELGDAQLERLFKFCCVRNPWERAISFYFSPHRGPVEWDKAAFIKLVPRIMPASEFVTLKNRKPRSPFENVDFVIRYENLNEDFRQVCSRLNIPPQELPVRNKSTRRPFSEYYDPALVELVRNHFRDDIDHFNYRF
jgi:hypothetical protein